MSDDAQVCRGGGGEMKDREDGDFVEGSGDEPPVAGEMGTNKSIRPFLQRLKIRLEKFRRRILSYFAD